MNILSPIPREIINIYRVKLNYIDWISFIFLILGLIVLIRLPFIEPYFGEGQINQQKAADFGTFVGGYFGTIFLLISIVIVLWTLSAQKKANQLQQFETKFLDLLKLHRENVAEMRLNNKSQRNVFVILRNEFQDLYTIVKDIYKTEDKDNLEKANITYLILFFGLGDTSTPMVKDLLEKYDKEIIEKIVEKVNDFREEDGYKKLTYLSKFKLDKYYPFNGHQSRLAHYFRHLYQTIKYIDSQNILSVKNKRYYAKTLRAQLSNHELAIFFYNSLSILGKNWSKNNKTDFIDTYQLLKNIPLKGFTFELNPEDIYKQDYEWNEITQPLTKAIPNKGFGRKLKVFICNKICTKEKV